MDMGVELVRRVDTHKIRPIIARCFEWSQAKDAFALLMDQSLVGKVVIKV